MTFGRALVLGAGFSLGAALMSIPIALVAVAVKRAGPSACPVCGDELPTELSCPRCGSTSEIQPPKVKALVRAGDFDRSSIPA